MYLAERPRDDPTRSVAIPEKRSRFPVPRGVSGTVWTLGVVSLLTDVSSESVSAILPVYLTAVLGLSPLAYGFLDGLYQGVSALVRILGGYLSDRFDRPKWVAAFGYGLSAVTKVFLITFHGFASLTTVITLDRLGKGLRTGPRDGLIAASTPSAQLGRAFGVHRALDTVGAAIGPLLAFTILWLVPGDYTSVFVVSLAAAILGVALLALIVPDRRPRADARDRAPQPAPTTVAVRPSLAAMRDHGMGRLVLAAGLLSVLAISDGFIYLTLQQRDNLAATYFPLLFVGTNVAYFLLAIPCGRLSDRIGRQRVLVGGHVLLVAAYLAAAGPAAGAVMSVVCLTCLGAYYAMTDGVLAALTASITPVPIRTVGIATTQTVVAVARFASSLIFGALWTAIGRGHAVMVFAAALVVVIPLAGWLLSSVARNTLASTTQNGEQA